MLGFFALLLGCVSPEFRPASDLGDDGLVVVERSKAEPPSWVTLAPGQVIDTPLELRIMTARSKLLNLPLGLRQTQLIGLDTARAALAAWLKPQLLAVSKYKPSDSPLLNQELERMLRASLDGPAGKGIKINDIYYEALINRSAPPGDLMANYYAVYILVAYPKDKLPLLFHDLSSRLRSSKLAEAQRLAPAVGLLEHPAP